MQAKLDELIRSSRASNKLIRAERLTEDEVEDLRPSLSVEEIIEGDRP